jgi:aspartate carbamoyltransferase catalytic subunit
MMQSMSWTKKDLITLESLTREEILYLFSVAHSFEAALQAEPSTLPDYTGKTFVNLFMEPSTRTRVAFEMAAARLKAHVINISSNASSLTKGESLRDTAQNLEALKADAIIMRHSAAGTPHFLSQHLNIPVINAGDGAHEHPTQGLLDAYTLCKHFGNDLSGKNITLVGDILFSRVARSNIWCLQKLGAHITLVGPSTLVPKTFEAFGPRVTHSLEEGLQSADAIMLLRIQHERQTAHHFPSLGEYRNLFGLTEKRKHLLKTGALILHPGPINRGIELDSTLADSGQSVILQQVTHGIYVRMAALHLCLEACKKA